MKAKVPQLLKSEHKELDGELVRATKAGGKTGERAKALTKVLRNHFAKEEEFALPLIGLMALLMRGHLDQEMSGVFAMTDRLKVELPKMRREHRTIISELKKLTATANREKKAQPARFAEKLMLHAQKEEKVLYPAAMLVGEYLSLRSGRSQFDGYC